jgi:hypothetical protein
MRGRWPPVVALALAITGLAAWRAACVLAGPDVDTDAYAHHMIARAILADPRDLAVHWVWLPLFHYLEVPLVALGGTMNDVRWANVALSAAVPVALYAYVRRTAGAVTGSAEVTALVAALFAAACPIVMQMGTTAQPEPLFALLTLGIAIGWQRRHDGATAAMLGAAVLLRYEAWAILAVIGATIAWERWQEMRDRSRGSQLKQRTKSPIVVVAVPVAMILAWAVLRRPVDGKWFGFLGQTHEFASQVAQGAHDKATARTLIRLVEDLLHYPLVVPARVLGPALPLALFGIGRTWRQQGARFVLVLTAVLGFVSLTWANRSSLGLDRHFVAVVPLYATFAAQGAAVIAERAGRWVHAVATAKAAENTRRATHLALSIASLAALGVVLVVWMGFWRGAIERGWPERARLGAYLRSLPDGTTIFCDDATLEILSGLDRHRFDRHWVDDPQTWTLVSRVAREKGVAYVATWVRKLSGHERTGDLVFRASDSADAPGTGVAVMRVGPEGGRAAR